MEIRVKASENDCVVLAGNESSMGPLLANGLFDGIVFCRISGAGTARGGTAHALWSSPYPGSRIRGCGARRGSIAAGSSMGSSETAPAKLGAPAAGRSCYLVGCASGHDCSLLHGARRAYVLSAPGDGGPGGIYSTARERVSILGGSHGRAWGPRVAFPCQCQFGGCAEGDASSAAGGSQRDAGACQIWERGCLSRRTRRRVSGTFGLVPM